MQEAELIRECEHMLICPSPGISHVDIEALLAEDFVEIGASGRTITRSDAIAALARRSLTPPEEPWHITGYELRRLSDDVCLATYSLAWGTEATRRSTIWRRDGETWRAAYHQGTNSL